MLQRLDDFNEPLEKAQNADSRIDYLEDQSRRNNLRINGIPENDSENWEQTTKKVQDLFKNNLGIEKTISIERAHRTGKKVSSKTRTIVAKLHFYPDKDLILKNSKKLKGSSIYINEDLCENSRIKRTDQLEKLKQARAQGKIAYFSHTRLVIKDRPNEEADRGADLERETEISRRRNTLRSAAAV